jgi:hypothetical protein
LGGRIGNWEMLLKWLYAFGGFRRTTLVSVFVVSIAVDLVRAYVQYLVVCCFVYFPKYGDVYGSRLEVVLGYYLYP